MVNINIILNAISNKLSPKNIQRSDILQTGLQAYKQTSISFYEEGRSNTALITHHRDEGALCRTVINDECELSFNVSQGMISRTASSVPQRTVSFYNDVHFICSFGQSIQLFQRSYVLDVPMKQAEDVIHNSEKPGEKCSEIAALRNSLVHITDLNNMTQESA